MTSWSSLRNKFTKASARQGPRSGSSTASSICTQQAACTLTILRWSIPKRLMKSLTSSPTRRPVPLQSSLSQRRSSRDFPPQKVTNIKILKSLSMTISPRCSSIAEKATSTLIACQFSSWKTSRKRSQSCLTPFRKPSLTSAQTCWTNRPHLSRKSKPRSRLISLFTARSSS